MAEPLPELRQTYTEAKSQRELAATEIHPLTARLLSWSFVAFVAGVPLLQAAIELRQREGVGALALIGPVRDAAARLSSGGWREAVRQLKPLFTRAFLHDYEEGLENRSVAKSFFQPRVQNVLTGWLRFGNDKGVVGREDWLFYQPGVSYLVGSDFVDRNQIQVRTKQMVDKQGLTDPHPDPRPPILQLHRDLAQRGIHLVVAPVPDKAMLQTAQLTRRLERTGEAPVPNNRGYAAFARELRAQGVDLVDLSPPSSHARDVRYLARDTHWTPRFMEETAQRLAAHIRDRVPLAPPSPEPDLAVRAMNVSRVGDLVEMLRLTPDQDIYAPEQVTVRQVVDRRSGEPWRPQRDADVLLLGDSFANIYSSPSLGWGEGAGLAAHLAYELRRPVDVIALNGGGAAGSRQALASAENADRLEGKRVVVYQFAMRDLAVADWTPVVLSPPAANGAAPAAPAPVKGPPAPTHGVTLRIVGRVLQTSRVPEPHSAPYDDCVTMIRMEVEAVDSGTYADRQLLAVFWAMKDNQWLPGARYAPGDRLRLSLVPLKEAPEEVRSAPRADDLADYAHLPYFVVSAEPR